MKRIAWIGLCAVALALGVAGCGWDTGGDAVSWSSDYNWVNFNGTYRGVGGGLLVTDYSTTPSIPGVTNIYTKTESGGTMPARGTTKSGQVSHGSIVPGSFMVTVGSIATLSDSAKNTVLSGNGSGTVNYEGGTWNIVIDTPDLSAAHNITISYSYTVTRDGTASSGAQPGSTGKIYSFVVVQQGEHLTFTDNNGATYTGYIGELRTASGTERNDAEDKFLPVDGDTVIANIECKGTSAALRSVKIVGSLQGTVAGGVFTDRRLNGTWIEMPGKTGDISGQTATVAIPTGTTDTGTDTNAVSTNAAFAVSLP
jgi:hypothetical protein